MFYFVLADRFYNGDPSNDTGGFAGGRMDHGFDPTVISHYHGGDFVGLTQKLDYLEGLGITAIWVTPPFQNKPVQQGTAGYHGYWITDFYKIDSHLGTNEEYRAFIEAAQSRGMRVYMDIIVNHTADVIQYEGGDFGYVPIATRPDRDKDGKAFFPWDHAYNGLGPDDTFPELDAETSFALTPVIPKGEENIKNPAWLNDVRWYHNRGNTDFKNEDSLFGDFVGLDDLYTEHPFVVQGFIDIYKKWMTDFNVDGFRIDTAKHVNYEFWQAFSPAIRDHAQSLGRPDFLHFGEVYADDGSAEFLSEYSTIAGLDSTLDFGVFQIAREFISRGGSASRIEQRFIDDDYYTDFDSNVHANVTFIGNHDAGRFGWFVSEDNPNLSDEMLLELVRMGHGLLYLSRGQPTLYYGAEQGMLGYGNDMRARETMFPSVSPRYRSLRLLGTDKTGADDKFDTLHPLYRMTSKLAQLREDHVGLNTGAMIVHPSNNPNVFAFSRFDREEQVEYLVAFNNSRHTKQDIEISVLSFGGTQFEPLFDSQDIDSPGMGSLPVRRGQTVRFSLEPLQFAVWENLGSDIQIKTDYRLTVNGVEPGQPIVLGTYEVAGNLFPKRQEITVDVDRGFRFGEMTFTMTRDSRPGQVEYLGTDETAPFRLFFRPPVDLAPNETFTLHATYNDLNGNVSSVEVNDLFVSRGGLPHGIVGAETPQVVLKTDRSARPMIRVQAQGTAPFTYQWMKDGAFIGAPNAPTYQTDGPGSYAVLVTNRAGAVVSEAVVIKN